MALPVVHMTVVEMNITMATIPHVLVTANVDADLVFPLNHNEIYEQ